MNMDLKDKDTSQHLTEEELQVHFKDFWNKSKNIALQFNLKQEDIYAAMHYYFERIKIKKDYTVFKALQRQHLIKLKEDSKSKFKKGVDYHQNYDFVVKWLAKEFKGKTLKMLGVDSAPIVNVITLDTQDILIKEGMFDILFVDITGMYFHMEEERNMKQKDMHRFSVYHFHGAEYLKGAITDIILCSGEPYTGDKIIETGSGRYAPHIIDLTGRDGFKRLNEIKKAVESGNIDDVLELVFVPLYGRDNKKLATQVLDFQLELYKTGRISKFLVAATIIMSNKFIDKTILEKIWEDVDMKRLDFIEFMKEKFKEEGREEGLEEGRKEARKAREEARKAWENTRESIIDILKSKLGSVPDYIMEKVHLVTNQSTLKDLLINAANCQDIKSFEHNLARAST